MTQEPAGGAVRPRSKPNAARNPRATGADPLDTLRKILRLEADQGFPDTTVTGGLDRFLHRRRDDLASALGDATSYSILTPPQRREWAEDVMARLGGGDELPQPRTTTPGHKPAPRKRRTKPADPIALDDSVFQLKWVTERTFPTSKLARLGVSTVLDLIYHLPSRHQDFANTRKVAELKPGEEQTIVADVWDVSASRVRPNLWSIHAALGDETGNIRATWFRRGFRNSQPFMVRSLQPGSKMVFSGKVGFFRGERVLDDPDYEPLKGQEELMHTGRLVPVYPTVEGITVRMLRRAVKQALDAGLLRIVDHLPQARRDRIGLMPLDTALAQAHYPDSDTHAIAALRRLAFDELLTLQLAVLRRKRDWQREDLGVPLLSRGGHLEAFLDSLPFPLTQAQHRVIADIRADLEQPKPMSRLLQGDVGSGKTVVAAAALLSAVFAGYQGAIVAPTEILAEQHFLTLSRFLSGGADPDLDDDCVTVRVGTFPKPVAIGLLVGSLPNKRKAEMRQRLADGSVDLVIGTHAVIQEDVEAPRLAVAVVDEQHRFGVMQRAALRGKGRRPHMLAMSATPIPRSLALTLYGELDVSTLDEMPPGRQPIRTRWIPPDRRANVYEFIAKQVEQGRQTFVICPLVEESEAIQSRAAIAEHERLSRDVFPDLRLGLLHGRMALREKEMAMEEFKNGDTHILVSTPVVEVGIDVPNATVMLIDGAERFGLSQLHQFRGRVGRGKHLSHCLLLADDAGKDARERLKIVERVGDGFELSEEDLRIRGPGDYLGTRQSGLPNLKVAKITDQDLLLLARQEAASILDADPDLTSDEHAPLAQHLADSTTHLVGELS